MTNICADDVKQVASSIGKELTTEQVNKVLAIYNHEEECDPHATWDLVTEHCIYQVLNDCVFA